MTKSDTVKNYITEKISSGKWEQGKKIFSENQLAEYLNVSRGTVRSAINRLIKENVLECRHGSGSYVKSAGETKNQIIIYIREKDINGEITESFKYVFNRTKEYVEEAGFVPISFVDNNILTPEEFIPESSMKKVAGLVSIFGKGKTIDFFREKYIPCVSTCRILASNNPSVLLDYMDFFFKLKYIISKYSLKDIVIFSRKQNLSKITYENKDSFFLFAIEKYFEKYDLHTIPISKDRSVNAKHIRTILSNLKHVPDAVIFLDDTLYNTARPYFPEFDHIMKNTKIITHYSHIETEEEEIYKPCKIIFDLDSLAKATVNQLLNFIKGEEPENYNIFIKTIVKNEEVLESFTQ